MFEPLHKPPPAAELGSDALHNVAPLVAVHAVAVVAVSTLVSQPAEVFVQSFLVCLLSSDVSQLVHQYMTSETSSLPLCILAPLSLAQRFHGTDVILTWTLAAEFGAW